MYVSDSSSAILMQSCTVQNSLADGLDMDMESQLVIQDSTIKNNSAAGVVIANESQLLLGTYPTQRIRITGNGFGGGGNGSGGLEIDGSQVQLNFGVLTVDGNAGAGISMDGGRLQLYGGDANTPGVIENNNVGLSMSDAASATLWSAFRIHNNGSTGISVGGASSITLISTVDSEGHNARYHRRRALDRRIGAKRIFRGADLWTARYQQERQCRRRSWFSRRHLDGGSVAHDRKWNARRQ